MHISRGEDARSRRYGGQLRVYPAHVLFHDPPHRAPAAPVHQDSLHIPDPRFRGKRRGICSRTHHRCSHRRGVRHGPAPVSPTLVPIESVPVFVAVGMVSLFGAVANAPIAVLVMVVEMVGSVTILVPSMAAVAISHLLTGERTIFREQVPTKSQSGAHRGEYDRRTLERILVRDAMIPRKSIIMFSPADELAKVLDIMGITEHTGFPVIEDGRLVGITRIMMCARSPARKECTRLYVRP